MEVLYVEQSLVELLLKWKYIYSPQSEGIFSITFIFV